MMCVCKITFDTNRLFGYSVLPRFLLSLLDIAIPPPPLTQFLNIFPISLCNPSTDWFELWLVQPFLPLYLIHLPNFPLYFFLLFFSFPSVASLLFRSEFFLSQAMHLHFSSSFLVCHG
jgi:hypothetical protein